MGDSLKFLLEDERYVQMGENGKKYAEENHDVTKIIQQYKTLFEKLVSRKTPADASSAP
jgi:glycosyltransferase involved in cell wall biosynthesis